MNIYPLIFEPILKPRIWGGRKLATLLNKKLPDETPIGESWEIADLEDDQSVVANGTARGKRIDELVKEWGADLLGDVPLFEGRFPLLIKFLDATTMLSVQVHPDAATAKRIGGRVRIKNEAWYVIDADEGGFIYRGLRPGVDAAELERAIEAGNVEQVLNRIEVRKGHCYYVPSGTIHALGAGVSVAEIQTPSDTTYRVYDWNRVDATTGKLRTLHVAEALGCIVSETDLAACEAKNHVASVWTSVTTLVRCESFVIQRVRMVDGVEQEIPHAGLVIWIILEGQGSIAFSGADESCRFGVGDTILLPAGLRKGCVRTDANCMWLEVFVPLPSSLEGFDRPARESLNVPVGDWKPVPLTVKGEPGQANREEG